MKAAVIGERERNFVYSKSEEESREEGGAERESQKVYTGPLSAAPAAFSCVE